VGFFILIISLKLQLSWGGRVGFNEIAAFAGEGGWVYRLAWGAWASQILSKLAGMHGALALLMLPNVIAEQGL
jgi:hypothetical protein